MAFLVYERIDSGTFKRRVEVTLGGQAGPFAAHVRATATGDTLAWHLSEADVLRHLGREPERHVFVIDTNPSSEKDVAIYRLHDVWGYSYREWTPIMLRLEELTPVEPIEDPKAFKEEIRLPEVRGANVSTFVYLQGGTRTDSTWQWGRVGSVNGALLFPDALRYFLDQIEPHRPQ